MADVPAAALGMGKPEMVEPLSDGQINQDEMEC